MMAQSIPVLVAGFFFLARRSCSGYFAPTRIDTSYLASSPLRQRHSSGFPSAGSGFSPRAWTINRPSRRLPAADGGKGFGPSSPNPSAYYPDDDYGDGNEDGEEEPMKAEGFEPISATPKGVGTLFEKGDEVIRELSSEEYTDILRDWAPLASFAANEAADPEIKKSGECIRTVLRGMAEWQPKRNSDYTKLNSKWAFGSPIGAIKGGVVDAMACIQLSEEGGVVIEWICANPATLGIPGNAVDWLEKGVFAICGKKLDLPVSIAKRAKGEYGSTNKRDEKKKKGKKSDNSKGSGSKGKGRR